MHRDDWNAVYLNQDRILNALKSIDSDIFLAGGTGLHRFILSQPYRHSEDLDFFFPTLRSKDETIYTAKQIVNIIKSIPQAKIEDERWLKDEQAYRMWCSFSDNEEIVKIELLNFTCSRLRDINFIEKPTPFKTENLYNMLLYKLKALCDRPDTIKDLFDLYFILRELPGISIKELILYLNAKFENAIDIRYEREDIIKALQHNLKWDIEIGEINHLYDLKNEIEVFQFELKDAFEKESVLEFSYQNRIKKRAKMYDMDIETYLELIDIIEENNFWIYEVKRVY